VCGKEAFSADLIYSPVVCFFKAFMRSLRLVLVTLYQDKVTAAAAIERGKVSALD